MIRTGSTALRSTTRLRAGLVAGALLTGVAAGLVAASPASATPSGDVTLCHATHSRSNPYVVITVDTSSVDEIENLVHNGHGDHVGPVFDPADDAQKEWGDIIPSFTNPDGSVYPGLNADSGAAFLAAGCAVPEPAEPVDEPTPVGSTPADDPAPTTSEPQPEESSSDPADPAEPAPSTSAPQPQGTSSAASSPQLARTGPATAALLAAGAAMVAAGSAAMAAGRRRGAHV